MVGQARDAPDLLRKVVGYLPKQWVADVASFLADVDRGLVLDPEVVATMMSRPLERVTSIGGVPRSKSGPAFSPQFALPARQPKTSCAVSCFTHLIAPLSRSSATIASAVSCAGALSRKPMTSPRNPTTRRVPA